MNSEKRYDEERLAELLQLLRPAPEAWVRRAREIPLAAPLSDADVAELARKLESDPGFRQRFDTNPGAAAEFAGMSGLATQLRREMRELVGFAERIASDSAYRAELDNDPQAVLVAAGVPSESAEPLLRALDVPEELFEKLEVYAHRQEGLSLKERLVMLLLGTSALDQAIRSATRL
jgi:hypothetical protein